MSRLETARDALHHEMSTFRADVRSEFAAVRSELAAVRTDVEGVREQMREMHEELGAAIIAANDETRRHMRVLHEDLVARIATIGEGGPTPSGQSPGPSPRTARRGR